MQPQYNYVVMITAIYGYLLVQHLFTLKSKSINISIAVAETLIKEWLPAWHQLNYSYMHPLKF